MQEIPVAACRRVIRYALAHVKGDLRGIEFSHIEQIRELLLSSKGTGRLHVPSVEVRLSFHWFRFTLRKKQGKGYKIAVAVPGEWELPDGNGKLQLELSTSQSVYNNGGYQLDWNKVSGDLELRNWQPGDLFTRAGYTGKNKLKDLFQKTKIPAWERLQWPVLTKGSSIVWTRNFGVEAEFVRSAETKTVLLIREIR